MTTTFEYHIPTATGVLDLLTQPLDETVRTAHSDLRRIARAGVASERMAERRAARRAAAASVKTWG